MLENLIQTFLTTFLSMLKIFLVMLAAGVLLRKKVLTPEHIKGLTAATVDVFLPCLTFYSITTAFKPHEFPIWWIIPLCTGALMLGGIGLGVLFFRKELPEKRNMPPLAGIHNGAYLVLPLGAVLFPDQFEVFSLYVLLYVLGQTPIIWSIGKYMLTAEAGDRFRLIDIFNPPLVATLLALAVVFSGLRDLLLPNGIGAAASIPERLADAVFSTIKLLGDATIPLALFILGGILGSISIRFKDIKRDVMKVSTVKFILLPFAAVLILYATGLSKHYPLLATFFVIQSSAPPAIVTLMQINKYGGDEQKVGSVLFITYLICLVAMPVWLSIWQLLNMD
jgi:predicted permease